MKLKKLIPCFLCTIFFVLGIENAQAQVAAESEKSALELIVGKRHGKMLVKVIPRSKEAWFYATRRGLNFSISTRENGSWSEFLPLIDEPLLPAPAVEFENFTEEPDYASAMKQAIYDQDFVPQSERFSDIHETNKDFSRQFLYYVLMSCYHPQLSVMSGLQIEIPTAYKSGFRIRAAANTDEEYTGELVVNTDKLPERYPGPSLEVTTGDRKANMIWEHEPYAKNIVAYQVFRSANGKDFSKLGAPVIFNATSPEGKKGMVAKTDSLPENYKDYSYNLRGYDPFGYFTEANEPVKVRGKDRTAPDKPRQLRVKQVSPNEVEIRWSHQSDQEFTGFQVIGAESEMGEYQKLHPNPLPPEQRMFRHNLERGFYKYYRVMAVDSVFNASVSDLGYMVEVDTIPPPIPTELEGVCDSSRVVSLSWKPSEAKDIKGYRVYKAYHPSQGFFPVTPKPLSRPEYTDSLSERLEKKVYYRISALDGNYNHSRESQYIAVEIPDMIPPTPPLLSAADRNDKELAELKWKPSSHPDVEFYSIEFLLPNDSIYQPLSETGGDVLQFEDADFDSRGLSPITYRIVAVDSSGNRSEPSNARRVFGPRQSQAKRSEISEAAIADNGVIINWPEDQSKSKNTVLVYRAVDDESYTILGRAEGESTFTDNSVSAGNTYKYKVGVIEPDGARWALSNALSVTVE